MTGKFGLRLYFVDDPEGWRADSLYSMAWNEVRLEAQRIAREGLWKTDTEFIPPSRIRSILVCRL